MKRIISIFLLAFICSVPLLGCRALMRESEPVQPHLVAYNDREQNPIRPIDNDGVLELEFSTNNQEDPLSLQLDELLQIVVDNKRPKFNAGLSPKVKQIYDNAVKVLNRYIKNDFTTFERVHAIHDYLTSAIIYDEQLYLEHLDDPNSVKNDDPSFNLEGVFINKLAVCAGFAKSFRLLCGIEGIKTETVSGLFSYNDSQIPHIWNKVEIDSKWYNIDCTMDSITFYPDKGDPINVIHHGFFLLSDDTLTTFGGHIFGGGLGYLASEDYSFHSEQEVFEGSGLKMQVNSQDELNAVFEYIKNANRKIGQVELKLNMGLNSVQVNYLDAYSSQITKAYSLVKDKDFSYSPKNNRIPFQKYPNGVFVFLIYK